MTPIRAFAAILRGWARALSARRRARPGPLLAALAAFAPGLAAGQDVRSGRADEMASASGAGVVEPPPSSPSSGLSPAHAAASAPSSQPAKHLGHSFSDTERFVQVFEDPARAAWQKPAEVVAALHVAAGQGVADIGSGSGYFTLPFARAVGPEGRVYAADIEPGMVDHVRARAKEEKAEAIVSILAAPDDARLPPDSTDLVFICDTWHHVGQREQYLKRLKPALRPGARIAIVDLDKRPLPVGPPLEEKLAREEVVAEFRRAGFALSEEYTFLPYQYFLVFTLAKPERPSADQHER